MGGGASVLLRKHRSYAEVYNDLDGEVVNLFRVLRDHGQELREKLELTPFSREEFNLAYKETPDPLERARHLLVRSFMGFGSDSTTNEQEGKPLTGFRSNSHRNGTGAAHDWANWPFSAKAIIQRLHGVVIENWPAIDVLHQHDSNVTLHYVDPPYVHSVRGGRSGKARHSYRHEMSDEDHRILAACLHSLQGMVIVSGYPSELYDELFAGWTCITRAAHADGARDRVECLWLSPNCQSPQMPLLEVAS